ncbi:hypothetical protein COY27_01910 [Candidatus Woesearchaeota archaeon CG_4_10_14_0_2_um_filter_33_13]|nr:MAG: hypothetical protein COY27_01910 [Candidatus Woesearchaeota archaeon CG_4_10_14_0_2_um_filter_33_13]
MLDRSDLVEVIDKISPFNSDGSRLYVVGSGAAVKLLANNDRIVSDLDILYLGDDWKAFAERSIDFEKAHDRRFEIDMQSPESYFGSISMSSQDVIVNYVVDVSLEGRLVPVLCPEFIAVSKLTSWMGSQEESLPHTSREKDALDIVALWETKGLQREKFEELATKVPHLDVSPEQLYNTLVRNIEMYQSAPSNSNVNILRNTTQIAEICAKLDDQDQIYQELTAFVADYDIDHSSSCLTAIKTGISAFEDSVVRREVYKTILDYSKKHLADDTDRITSGLVYRMNPTLSADQQAVFWDNLKRQIDTYDPVQFLRESMELCRAERE